MRATNVWIAGAMIPVLAGLTMLPLEGPSSAERADADVSCAATDEELVYECTIVLKGRPSGAPIPGAEITVKADMPSMPMAHNVRPVQATPAGMPGHYRTRLELEMHGEWALTLDVSGPVRDRVVRKLHFGEMKHGGMGHGGMKHE